jgi:hypothetical protein
LDAISKSEKYPTLKKAMANVLASSKLLARKCVREVITIISNEKIAP